jgi:hypothetical protein
VFGSCTYHPRGEGGRRYGKSSSPGVAGERLPVTEIVVTVVFVQMQGDMMIGEARRVVGTRVDGVKVAVNNQKM